MTITQQSIEIVKYSDKHREQLLDVWEKYPVESWLRLGSIILAGCA
jgi:hypothetical protein